MPKTSFRTPSSRIASAVWSSFFLAGAAFAQTTEGRQVAPLTNGSGAVYERKRLKRTVGLENLSSWDLLYQAPEGKVYFNWDEQHLYLAMEVPEGQEVRFDLDASGDGWFRGAENFSIRLIKTPEGIQPLVRRFDTVQNKEHPVWAEVIFPAGSLQGQLVKTATGVASVVVLPITLLGPTHRPGTEFGLRALTGTAALTDAALEPSFVRLQLADVSEAIEGPLAVRLSVRGRQYTTGDQIRGTLEFVNSGLKPIFLKQVFLPDGTTVTNPRDPILIVNPGEKIRREFRMLMPEGAEPASVVLRGGVERESGGSVAALISIDRLEPFGFALDHDSKPISALAPEGATRRRLVVATVTGRREGKTIGQVQLTLPTGWSVEGEQKRTLSLSYPNERRSVSFKVGVPTGVAPGTYPIEVLCEIGGKSYREKAEFIVQ